MSLAKVPPFYCAYALSLVRHAVLTGHVTVQFRIFMSQVWQSFLCTYQCKAGGKGGRVWGGDLIIFVGPGVRHLTNLVLPGEGIFESLFARCGPDVGMDLTADSDERDWDRTYVSPLPRLTYGLERSGDHGSQRELSKGEWILLYWSIEPFKILWYQSKRK